MLCKFSSTLFAIVILEITNACVTTMDRNAITGAKGANTPGRNRRRSVLKVNIYEKGLTPRVSMGDGGSKYWVSVISDYKNTPHV